MKNGNNPAYPRTTLDGEIIKGLSKRELFAAMAMQGYMANYYTPHQNPEHVAEYAVKCADALLIELEK